MSRKATAAKDAPLFGEVESPTKTKDKPKAEAPKPAASKGQLAKVEAGPRAVASPPQAKSMLQVISEAVMDPRCDVAKMRELVNLQREIEADQAKKAFNAAFRNLQRALPTINKDGNIDHGTSQRTGRPGAKSKYATYPALMEICKPLLDANGFFLSSLIEPSADNTRIEVVTTLAHDLGHEKVSRFPLSADTTGAKNNQQGWGSSQQYGMRYNAIALLNIVSKAKADADNDGYPAKAEPKKGNQRAAEPDDGDVFPADRQDTGVIERITEEEAMRVREAIEDCGVTMRDFLARFRIDAVVHLPKDEYRNAISACANYKASKQNAPQTRR